MIDFMKSSVVTTANRQKVWSKRTTTNPPAWHAGYLRMLPAIRRQASIRLRHLREEARGDALQEILADTAVAYARLAELGKDGLAFPTPLVDYAVAKFRAGRRVGNRINIRDVLSKYCQQRKRIVVERINHFNDTSGEWQEMLVEDRHASPADVATIRIDFCEWLKTLPVRTCRIAQLLATGESTKDVAQTFAVSASRISQLRKSLRSSWLSFIGESSGTIA
jgi:hypothetical protein